MLKFSCSSISSKTELATVTNLSLITSGPCLLIVGVSIIAGRVANSVECVSDMGLHY